MRIDAIDKKIDSARPVLLEAKSALLAQGEFGTSAMFELGHELQTLTDRKISAWPSEDDIYGFVSAYPKVKDHRRL